MISATIPLFFLLAITSNGTSSSDVSGVVGIWEGESKCTVPDSPCHDEHVVYEVKAQWQKLVIDGYKIVNGEKQFMGTIECGEIKDGKISCTIPRKNKTASMIGFLRSKAASWTALSTWTKSAPFTGKSTSQRSD